MHWASRVVETSSAFASISVWKHVLLETLEMETSRCGVPVQSTEVPAASAMLWKAVQSVVEVCLISLFVIEHRNS